MVEIEILITRFKVILYHEKKLFIENIIDILIFFISRITFEKKKRN